MRTVSDMLDAARGVDIHYLAGLSLAESGGDFIREQQAQIFAGEREDGTQIFNVDTGSEFYSDSYARYKGKDEPIDLKDKGGFFREMFTRQESEGLFIDSEDWKAKKLGKRYEPWLLNDQSKGHFIPLAWARMVGVTIKQLNNEQP